MARQDDTYATVKLIVCLFVCSLVWRLTDCLFVCLFVCLLVCWFACLFVSFFACLFVCLFVCLFACLFVGLFVSSLVMRVMWWEGGKAGRGDRCKIFETRIHTSQSNCPFHFFVEGAVVGRGWETPSIIRPNGANIITYSCFFLTPQAGTCKRLSRVWLCKSADPFSGLRGVWGSPWSECKLKSNAKWFHNLSKTDSHTLWLPVNSKVRFFWTPPLRNTYFLLIHRASKSIKNHLTIILSQRNPN